MIVATYLIAIVIANLLVAKFGPSITILNAFLFIGLDITARDKLHEQWSRRGLVWKMGALIATGSALSALLNWQARNIAVASFAAFAAAALVDALVYHLLRDNSRFVRVNGSNVPSALVDSAVFPVLAFGFPLLIPVMAGQFAAKVLGGLAWLVIIEAVYAATPEFKRNRVSESSSQD